MRRRRERLHRRAQPLQALAALVRDRARLLRVVGQLLHRAQQLLARRRDLLHRAGDLIAARVEVRHIRRLLPRARRDLRRIRGQPDRQVRHRIDQPLAQPQRQQHRQHQRDQAGKECLPQQRAELCLDLVACLRQIARIRADHQAPSPSARSTGSKPPPSHPSLHRGL